MSKSPYQLYPTAPIDYEVHVLDRRTIPPREVPFTWIDSATLEVDDDDCPPEHVSIEFRPKPPGWKRSEA